MAKEVTLAHLNNKQAVKPFRGQWQYNNLGYELADLVIEQVAGQRWDRVLKSRILQPLRLTRTNAMAKEMETPKRHMLCSMVLRLRLLVSKLPLATLGVLTVRFTLVSNISSNSPKDQ